jgi:ribulose-phosphate 3-epimerase
VSIKKEKRKAGIAPSILTADFSALGGMFEIFERHPSIGYIHCDVMDGDFVPNISFGAPVIQSLAGKTKLPFDIHLMVTEPGRFIPDYVCENTEYIVVHAEASVHLDRTLRLIKSCGVKCGVALNPATPPAGLECVFELVDQVLVMSVNPGYGGQQFIPSSFDKIKQLNEIRLERRLDFKIAVDGGISKKNVLDVIEAGAEIIIVGSAILNADDPEAELSEYDELLRGVNDV